MKHICASLLIFLLSLNSLSATYIFIYDKAALDEKLQRQLFDLILRGEPPRSFCNRDSFDLKEECERLFPMVRLEWIPPSVWQIAVLHAFFHDEQIRKLILTCKGRQWEPLAYEGMVHQNLSQVGDIEELAECFDALSRSIPQLPELFFKVNQSVVSLYQRVKESMLPMLQLALSELPSFDQWSEKGFPFWESPWIYNPQSARIFYDALMDEVLLAECVKIEELAHEKGEWVLYRGYSGKGYPSTLQHGGSGNHALSFGSTLLGGTFFSLEATALTYSKPDRFLALRVSPDQLKQIFRVGPLHPLVQLLVDGEMFHAHTKIAASEYREKSLDGYFMKCNQHCVDPLGYLLHLQMTPEELERAFLSLCEESGHVFDSNSRVLAHF